VEASSGRLFKTVGDAFCAAFVTARQVLEAPTPHRERFMPSRGLKSAGYGCAWLCTLVWPRSATETISDRSATEWRGSCRLGIAGRSFSVASFGLVRDALGFLEEAELRNLGEYRPEDLRYTGHVYQLAVTDLPSEFPPLNTHELVTPAPEIDTPGGRR
jgi:hypothetical protein